MPGDSSAVDAAIVAALLSDATLSSLMPDGVFIDEANPNAKRFVVVSLIDHRDVAAFGGRAYEDALYLVKAVAINTSGSDVKAAAARIDAVLEDEILTAPGYVWMTGHRESRIRSTEVDEVDRSIRWQHRGGRYRVQVSPAPED
jgi:hypothetical protein